MQDFFLGIVEITLGMTVLILLMLPILRLIGGKFTAKCRYILWALVLVRLAVPLSFGILPALIEVPVEAEPEQLPVQILTPAAPSAEYIPVQQNPVTIPPQEELQIPVPPSETPVLPEPDPLTWDDIAAYLPYAYLTGAAVFLLWNLLAYGIYTGKILRSAKTADSGIEKIYTAVCLKKELRHPPVLLISPTVSSPAAFGLIRRRIVLPDITFTENALVGTLSHEVTHCKRGDLWSKTVCLIARSLHWFNPLVHLAAFRCEMEMELSCDESVLAGCGEDTRAAYGEIMLDIIRRCRNNRGALTTHFNPKKNAVKLRLQNILYGSGKRRGTVLIVLCLVLCLIAGAIVACRTEESEDETGSETPEVQDEPLPETPETGEYPSMDAYVNERMAQNKTVTYYSVSRHSEFPDGGAEDWTATASITDTKLTVFEKKGEVAGLFEKGVLECWEYRYLLKLDVPAEDVMTVDGDFDGWFDMDGQHTVVALRYPDGTYTVLMDERTGDGIDFTGYRATYEEAIYDWYVTEAGLDLPLYVEEWGNQITSPTGDYLGNQPVHRFDGDGWGIYIPVSAWYQSPDSEKNRWIWCSSYLTGSMLTVDVCSHTLEEEYTSAENQGYTPADNTSRIWELQKDDIRSYYYYYSNPNGGFWRVSITWTEEAITDYPYIAIEPQVLRLMAESFVVFGTGNKAANAVTITSPIYLCDDVYRSETTPTHGESTITFPSGLNGYKLYTCEVLLCGDECDPQDVVWRNFFGYAGGYDLQEMELTQTGSYPAKLYLMEYPEDIVKQILSDMEKGGASEEEKLAYRNRRWYLYLLTVDADHYACIFLEPENMAARPENEQEILDAMVASVEIDITRISKENWTQYMESHTVSGQEFTVSFTCPEEWQIESGGILNDENGKRIGERVFRENFSFAEFKQEFSHSSGHSVLNNPDSPYQGSTDSGMEYVGYHNSVTSSIDYSGAEVYTFLIQYSDSMFMHISVWQQDTDPYEDFLNSVVLPIVNSVAIEQMQSNDLVPPVSTADPDTIWQNFLNTVIAPYSDYIVASEFLDLDGNGIDELIVYDWGASANCGVEIFTIENGEVRSFSTLTNAITHHSGEATSLAPPSANAVDFGFWGLPTSYSDKMETVLWFNPCTNRNGHVLYSMNGSSVHKSEDYYYFTSDENGCLTVELLRSFLREAIDSNPANGWKCYINGNEEPNLKWFCDTMSFFRQDLAVSHGVQYHENNTASDLDELEPWIEESAEEIVPPEEPSPDRLVTEDNYSQYTREEWIKYHLNTDFGFREPVDVTTLPDSELETYMADAYLAALDMFSMHYISSDGMYGQTYWSTTMPNVIIDGKYYSQMFNPVFPTLSDLESYLNGIFTPEITAYLMVTEMFIDYEGELWGIMGARGTDIGKKTVGYSIKSRTDTEIIYTAEVEVREDNPGAEEPDYVEYHDFTYALTENGWRWTDFYLYF